ncbi:hypothetical protein TKK_0006957 [Trichogramma kaykai]
MANNSNVVRVKEEPSDTWSNAGDDYVFDFVDSCKAENLETLPFHKLSRKHKNEAAAFNEKLDNKIFIGFECKYVKPDLPTTIYKTEHLNSQPIVNVENQINTKYSVDKEMLLTLDEKFFSKRRLLLTLAYGTRGTGEFLRYASAIKSD